MRRFVEMWQRLFPLTASQGFDRASQFYGEGRIPIIRLNDYFLRQEAASFRSRIVVDVGCGPGNSTGILLAAGAHFVHCVDASSDMLKLNWQRHGATGCIQNFKMDPHTELPTLPNTPIEGLVFSQSIGFLSDPDRQIEYYSRSVVDHGLALIIRIPRSMDVPSVKPVLIGDQGQHRRVWIRHFNRDNQDYQRIFENHGWRLETITALTVSQDHEECLNVSPEVFQRQCLGQRMLECLRFVKLPPERSLQNSARSPA